MSLLMTSGILLPNSGMSSPFFEGDAYETSSIKTHTFNNSSSSDTSLPSIFTGGTKVVALAVYGTTVITSVTVDGTTANLRASETSGTERTYIYDAIIVGGVSNDIVVVTVANEDDMRVAMFDVAGKSYSTSSTIDIPNTNAQQDFDMNTSSGDVCIANVLHNKTGVETWGNLTENCAERNIGGSNRYSEIASNLNCSGGSPEAFSWNNDQTFVNGSITSVIYN